MPKLYARLTCAYDMLPTHDMQAMHQAQGKRAPHNAIEEETVDDAITVIKVWRSSPEGAPVRMPQLLPDASN